MPPLLSVGFGKFWEHFDPENNLFTRLLRDHYDLRFTSQPEVLFYSDFPGDLPQARRRVYFSGEPTSAPLSNEDWSITTSSVPSYFNRHFYLPYFAFEEENLAPLRNKGPLERKKYFCAFVYSKSVGHRDRFCQALSQLEKIHCPGKVFNNGAPIGDHLTPKDSRSCASWREAKIDYLRQFRFTIAIENRQQRGYATEKILDAMLAGSIPIYWGDPDIGKTFNTNSFIHLPDDEPFLNWGRVGERVFFQRAVQRISQLRSDPDALQALWDQPWFRDDAPPPYHDGLRNFLRRVGDTDA